MRSNVASLAVLRRISTAVDRPSRAAAISGVQLPHRERIAFAVVVVVAIFLPEALGFFAFGLRLTPARLMLLVLSPVMLISFAHLIGSERYRFVLADFLVPVTAIWMVLALAETDGWGVALKSGGVAGLETVGPYLVTRCMLRNREQVHAIVKLVCVIAAFSGPLGLADTIAQHPIIHDQLARITGYTYFHTSLAHNPANDYRLGLFRAQGIFEDPILFGIIMCYSLILTTDLHGYAKTLCRFGCGLGLFLSLSSAPWGSLIVGIALWLYLRFAPFPYRWLVLTVAGAMIGTIFLTVMTNPFGWLFNHFTFDPATGYFRLMIWQYAGHDLMQSPIVGLGTTEDWFRPPWMPSSVDSVWLHSAMVFGIPGAVLSGLSIVGAASFPVARRGTIELREVRLSHALEIIIFLTIALGFTVDYWGASEMMVGLVAGMRAVLGQVAAQGRSSGYRNEHGTTSIKARTSSGTSRGMS
jgi:hypothetical protein